MQSQPRGVLASPLFLLLLFVSGLGLGWFTALGTLPGRNGLDMPLLGQAWEIIHQRYVDQAAVKPRRMTYGAIAGMVDALGDTGHSTFLPPSTVKHLKEMEHGELKGIGVQIQMKRGHVVIVAPLDNSPAQHAGLRAGDVILKVNGQDISGWPPSRVVERITGPAGTQVELTVLSARTGKARQLTITRAAIQLHEVTWQLLPGTAIAHLRIAEFDAGATKDIIGLLPQIQREAEAGIILDLRDDPGGLLDEAVGVTSQFLASGNVLLAKDAKGHITPIPVEKGGQATDTPVVVLINDGTASAAEIVAGALRDTHRATLVGGTTLGTGTVLEQFGLPDGSALLLAVEEWLTPDGHSFWHKGLEPEVAVAMPDDAAPLFPEAERDMTPAQLQSSDDHQLLRAVSLLEHANQRAAK